MVAAAFSAVIGLVCLSWLRHGGFMQDDWALSATYRYGYEGTQLGVAGAPTGYFHGLHDLFESFKDRPTAAAYFAATHALFGVHQELHVLTALVAAVALATALFVFLSTLGLGRVHAVLVAGLTLLFPFADTPRFWATGAQVTLAPLLVLVGALLALRGLRSQGKARIAWHAGALAAYASSVLTYQQTIGLVAFMAIPYALMGSWRAALRRSVLDVAVVVVAAGVASANTAKETQPVDPGRIVEVYGGSLEVLGAAVLPDPYPLDRLRALGAVAALAVLLAAGAARLLKAPDDVVLRRWLFIAGLSGLWILAAYVALLPAVGYIPTGAGIGNRINLTAGPGYAMLLYATFVVASLLLVRERRRAFVLAGVVALLWGLAYASATRRHAGDWVDAYREGQRVLSAIRTSLPHPLPRSATIFTIRHRTDIHGVPQFSATWDLRSAVKVNEDAPTVRAFPLPAVGTLTCERDSAHASSDPTRTDTSYGAGFLVDVELRRSVPISSRRSCSAARAMVRRAARG